MPSQVRPLVVRMSDEKRARYWQEERSQPAGRQSAQGGAEIKERARKGRTSSTGIHSTSNAVLASYCFRSTGSLRTAGRRRERGASGGQRLGAPKSAGPAQDRRLVPRNASLILWNLDVAAASPGCLSGWYLCAVQGAWREREWVVESQDSRRTRARRRYAARSWLASTWPPDEAATHTRRVSWRGSRRRGE